MVPSDTGTAYIIAIPISTAEKYFTTLQVEADIWVWSQQEYLVNQNAFIRNSGSLFLLKAEEESWKEQVLGIRAVTACVKNVEREFRNTGGGAQREVQGITKALHYLHPLFPK